MSSVSADCQDSWLGRFLDGTRWGINLQQCCQVLCPQWWAKQDRILNSYKIIRLSGFRALRSPVSLGLCTGRTRVGAIANTACCFSSASGGAEQKADIIFQQATWLQNFNNPTTQTTWGSSRGNLPNVTWFFPFLGTAVAMVLLLPFGPWVFNLLAKSVSSRLQ